MEILDNQVTGSSDHALTDKIRLLLITTAKWGRFLAIVGFVLIALLVVMLFSFGSIMSVLSSQAGMPAGMPDMGGFMVIPFALLTAFYFFPTLYLYQFSTNILKGMTQQYDLVRVEFAFEKLKSLFKFIGIFTLVIVSFYGLILFFTLIGLAIS